MHLHRQYMKMPISPQLVEKLYYQAFEFLTVWWVRTFCRLLLLWVKLNVFSCLRFIFIFLNYVFMTFKIGFLVLFFPFQFFFFNLLFWLSWVFVAFLRLSLVAASAGDSLLWCADFSLPWFFCCRAQALEVHGFPVVCPVVVAHGIFLA